MAAPQPAVYPDLPGRSVCVTGAARGLGLAMAEAFARAGCHVLLLDLDGDELARVGPALADAHPDQVIATAAAAVDDQEGVAAALAEFTARTGGLSVMVNNAGLSANAPSLDLELARWHAALDVNLTGVFVCARAAAPYLREQPDGGVILNTSSMYGVVAAPERAAYCATKAAVAALTKVLAVEWAPYGIRVNGLAPGYVATDLLTGLADAGRLDVAALRRRTPNGRLGTPADIAHLALFLASDVAAHITGQIMVSDGGWTADGYAVRDAGAEPSEAR